MILYYEALKPHQHHPSLDLDQRATTASIPRLVCDSTMRVVDHPTAPQQFPMALVEAPWMKEGLVKRLPHGLIRWSGCPAAIWVTDQLDVQLMVSEAWILNIARRELWLRHLTQVGISWQHDWGGFNCWEHPFPCTTTNQVATNLAQRVSTKYLSNWWINMERLILWRFWGIGDKAFSYILGSQCPGCSNPKGALAEYITKFVAVSGIDPYLYDYCSCIGQHRLL